LPQRAASSLAALAVFAGCEVFGFELAGPCRRIRRGVTTRTSILAGRGCICLALGLITLAVYWPSLTHDFLAFDDQAYVTENPQVRAGLTWPGVVWAFESFSVANWHPLTWLSHMLDCQLYGLKPAGHHLTNLLLHTASTLLLFLVLNRMTGAPWRSACVAALFAWHPLHVESVAWVAERKDVLSAFFFMLTLWAYERYAEAGRKNAESPITLQGSRFTFHVSLFYLLSLFFFALGLMSKPMLVTLPFVLLLLDYWPLRRVQLSTLNLQPSTLWRLVVEKTPFLALSAVACVLTVAAQRQGFAVVSTAGLPLSRRIPHVLVSYVHYLGAMLLPRHLAAHYPYVAAVPAFEAAGAAILLALLTFLAFRLAARRPYLVVGWLWYLGTLVPVIGLVQVGDQAWADRYTYIPLIGLFLAMVWGVSDLAFRPVAQAVKYPGTRLALGALAAMAGLAMLAATSLQLRHWRNTRTLFEHAAAVTQNNTRAITVLGSLLAAEGKLEEAKRLYALALSYSPDNPETHFNLGKVLDQQGRLDEAIAEYSQSLWSRQWRDKAHILMGVALAKEHKYEEAVAHYRAALALNPKSATAENNLARVLHSQGRLEEAREHYEAALKLDPQLAQAQNNLGVLLLQQGRLAEGVPHLREAVRLMPGDAESQYNLAVALNQQENWKEAAAIFGRLAPDRPNDAKLHYEFGLALAHLGQTREAMSHYARALRLQPDFPDALDRLAWIAATDPRPELRNGPEAVNMAQRACDLTQHKQAQYLATLAAAYAEAGRSAEAASAAETAEKLAASAGQKEMAAKCGNLLEAVKSGKPWRETPNSALK
jgi:tetratricopeptide (TPR) repeat protein